jgi:DNA-binding NtrC family response regulator
VGSTREIAVDVKVVVASNTPLADAVAAGRFRPDLYMRLSPATRVVVPTLRERPADLPFLARRFVARALEEADIGELREQVARAVGLRGDAEVSLVIGRASGERAGDGLELVLPEPAWKLLEAHPWPGNLRELSMVVHNLVAFTLVAAVDAIRAGLPLSSPRLQIDTGLVGELLTGSAPLGARGGPPQTKDEHAPPTDGLRIQLEPGPTLNAVAASVERQYFLWLFRETNHDFGKMAEILLGDARKSRAVRLRFNQLGLKVRELRDA